MMARRFVFATGNKGKLREAREILGPEYEIVSPADLGIFEEPEENGSTFAENSLIKARFIYEKTGLDCFADDSGLCVDALGGAPGLYSARYAGAGHDFEANIVKLLHELADNPMRKACFHCAVALIVGGEEHVFQGDMPGKIGYEKAGCGGFGYDPIFIPDGYDKTNAELGDEIKNRIAHRGKALRAMTAWLDGNK